MTSRTHDIFAFASLIVAAVYLPPEKINPITGIIGSIGSIVGALLPDIDQASNRLWDLVPGGDFIGSFLRKIFIAHRTLSHSLLGISLVYGILGFILPRLLNAGEIDISIVKSAIMIGYLSHLVLDSFTQEGLPLLFPLKLKFGFPPFAKLRVKTGSWVEKFVVFPAILVFIVWFVGNNQSRIADILKTAVK